MTSIDLRRTFVLANEFKEGDLLVGGTADPQVRAEARRALEGLRLAEITSGGLVDDGVTDALTRAADRAFHAVIGALRVGDVKRILLGADGAAWAARYAAGLSSEAIAAVAKTMTNAQLSAVARKLFNPLPGRGVCIGAPGHFGSRIQPNSPGDDEEEILFSILEGLTYGCGDVILGINPAADDVDTIVRLQQLLARVVDRLALPTRTCVLSDLAKQTAARSQTPMDVGFQSLAGTSKALIGMLGLDVDGVLDLAQGFHGLYFETGQGSEVTNGAAEGVDMVCLEARTYGVARLIQRHTDKWTIVNDVAGFIGPEVFRNADQLLRACLEDSVMAKLHGLTMGLDVCATFHMGIPPSTLHGLTETIVERAAPAYLMAVAGNADPMLGYLTTSFREYPPLRARTHRRMTTAMERRLTELELLNANGQPADGLARVPTLYARYQRGGGDSRSVDDLSEEARRKIARLQEGGWDLGLGHGPESSAPPPVERRLEAIYLHARKALYARIDPSVIRDVSPHHLAVRTEAVDREDYLAHPRSGERIRAEDAARVRTLYPSRRPRVQLVLSDGLNANALSENLRSVVPPLRQLLSAHGIELGETDVVVANGRVRAGYHLGALLDVEVVVHLIGERPGTGLNTLSAYLTYGRDVHGRSRWSPELNHSCTTAICGIHRRAKRPDTAVGEIAAAVRRVIDERHSGVATPRAVEG